MAIKSETKTLRLTFVDGVNKNVQLFHCFAEGRPRQSNRRCSSRRHHRCKNTLSTDDGGNLTGLKSSQIVTRKVEITRISERLI